MSQPSQSSTPNTTTPTPLVTKSHDTSMSLRRRAALWVARPFFALAILAGRCLPRRQRLAVAGCCGRAVYYLFPGVRGNLLNNGACILGPKSVHNERKALALEILVNFAHFIMEWVAPDPKASDETIFDAAVGKEHFLTAADEGKGVIAVSLHMGTYEVPGRALARLRSDVAIVFQRENVGFLEAIRSRTRQRDRLDEIVIDASPFFSLEVLRRLRAGGTILIAGDQLTPEVGLECEFLHGRASFSLWAARLALASGAPVVPTFYVRGPDSVPRVEMCPAIHPNDFSNPEELTAALIKIYARYLRAHAGEWLMVHRFWNESGSSQR